MAAICDQGKLMPLPGPVLPVDEFVIAPITGMKKKAMEVSLAVKNLGEGLTDKGTYPMVRESKTLRIRSFSHSVEYGSRYHWQCYGRWWVITLSRLKDLISTSALPREKTVLVVVFFTTMSLISPTAWPWVVICFTTERMYMTLSSSSPILCPWVEREASCLHLYQDRIGGAVSHDIDSATLIAINAEVHRSEGPSSRHAGWWRNVLLLFLVIFVFIGGSGQT